MHILKDTLPPLDYAPCRYGASRIQFRGPERPLDGQFVAAVGGSETYGKFVAAPFVDLLETHLGEPVVNLGVMQAGLTLIADDPTILPVASRARMTIVQVLGAQNMSNRFYMVHPRRNDRFLAASPRLRELFPDVDFAEINFTGHLLSRLAETGRPAFDDVIAELKTAWIYRMRSILDEIAGDAVLLWLSDRRPEDNTDPARTADPLFVDRGMLDALAAHCAGVVEVVIPPEEAEDPLAGKLFLPSETRAASAMPGPVFHARAAAALASAIAMPENLRRAERVDAPPHFDPRVRASR